MSESIPVFFGIALVGACLGVDALLLGGVLSAVDFDLQVAGFSRIFVEDVAELLGK